MSAQLIGLSAIFNKSSIDTFLLLFMMMPLIIPTLDAATMPQSLSAVLEVDQLATVAGMVCAGLGISIVPSLALYQFRLPNLTIRPLRWPGLTRQIYLVQKRDRGFSVAAESFCEWVKARRP